MDNPWLERRNHMEPMPIQPEAVSAVAGAIGMAMILILVLVGLVVYLFGCFCMAHIAKKMGMSFWTSFIMAIIPIANLILLAQMANKPIWWFVLMLIPLVNIVIFIILWMAISERLGKPGWWGVIIGLIFIPFVNLVSCVFFLILTFSAAPATIKQQPTA